MDAICYVGDIVRKITIRALGTQISALSIHVLSSISENNKRLLINNRFRFQGNIVKANRIGESMCSVHVPIFLCL
jgi:hypothetical protein